MRIKDLNKQDAIITATVELVNEIGFVSSSVSKIAKKANVSPATIYIYYKNKEDLLVSTYIEIKKKMSKAFLQNFDDTKSLKDILKVFWNNGFKFVSNNRALFQYTEQFANSPFSELVNQVEMEKHFEPMIKILQKGIETNIIKDVPFDILTTFVFYPIMILSNPKSCKNIKLDENNIDIAFDLAWDAIKN